MKHFILKKKKIIVQFGISLFVAGSAVSRNAGRLRTRIFPVNQQ
jgi:hypothetical protein